MERAMFFFMCMLILAGLPAEALDIAVIVNKQNPVSKLTSMELSKILKLEKQYWEGGMKVYLVLQESGSSEKQIVLKRVYRMDDEGLKKYWLGKMFRGEISSFPKTLGSSEAVKRFISQVPNAIGFIDNSTADASVKVLLVDGRTPGDQGYSLTGDK